MSAQECIIKFSRLVMQNEGLLGSLGMNADVMVMAWDWERLALYVSMIRPSCFARLNSDGMALNQAGLLA